MSSQQKNTDQRKKLFYRLYRLKNGCELVLRVPMAKDAKGMVENMIVMDSQTRFLARDIGEFNYTVKDEEDFIRYLLEEPREQMLIAEIEGEIIGNCAVRKIMDKARYKHRAAIGIAIDKDYWNIGIGRIMFEEAIRWSREKGYEQLELEVVTENERAVRLYKKMGFEICGTRKHALKYKDGSYADEHLMTLML